MKHAKRRRLTTEDINDALRTSDMQVCKTNLIIIFPYNLQSLYFLNLFLFDL